MEKIKKIFGKADSHSGQLTPPDILAKGVLKIRQTSKWAWNNCVLVITLNRYYINLTDLTKVETISDQKLLTSFDSINRKEQDKLINTILVNKDTGVFEAALRTSWLKNYEPFNKSPTHLLILMMVLGHIPIVECLSYSHSDEIEWNFTDQDGNSLFHIALVNVKLDPEFMKTFFRDKRIELNPFINKITESNQSLLSMACKRRLQPVIELLINECASIFITDPTMETGFWILPAFSNVQLGTNLAKSVVIYTELTNGNCIYSSITIPGKVKWLKVNEFKPFNDFNQEQALLLQILKFPSSNLITVALGKQLREINNIIFLAVEHCHQVTLRELLKSSILDLTQEETETRNNVLHKAIELKNNENLDILMEKLNCPLTGMPNLINSRNKLGYTPIDYAIKSSQLSAVAIIFDNAKEFLFYQWFTRVENAITNCDAEILKVLMNYFNDEVKGNIHYEQTSDQGLSILHIAVQKYSSEEVFNIILNKYKSQDVSKRLIDCKITSQSNDFKGFTPLLLSLKLKQYFATAKLLEAGASSLNEGNLCYFHLLIQFCGQKIQLKELLNVELNSSQLSCSTKIQKVRIWEVTDNECNTLLHYSIKCCNSVAIELLGSITPFPDLFKPDSKGNSLLHTAAALSQDPNVMDCLVETLKTHRTNTRYCELLNLQNKNDGYTALMSAVSFNHSKAVISLIQEGASILPLNLRGDSILHIATKEGKEEIFQLILDFIDNCRMNRASHLNLLHQPNSKGYSPIQCAVNYGQVGIVKLFREKHDLSICYEKTGNSLLHLAVLLKSIDLQLRKNLIDELLTEKSLLETRDRDGRTPLMLSTINHTVDSINILLPCHPDLLAIDAQGLSLLHSAVISYDKKTFDKILKAIVSDKNVQEILNFVDKQKMTVLHYSILKTNEEATEEILKHSLSLEARDFEGNTYLHVAAKSPNTINILKLIIRHSKMQNNLPSLLKKQNNKYFTPLLHAICYKNYEACKTLISEKANLFYQTVNGVPAFHQTINKLILTICEYQTDYYIGYCFPCNGNNTCWILTSLTNMETLIHVSNIPITVVQVLNHLIVQTIVSCPLVQPLQTLLQQVNFSKCSSQRKKSSLYMPASHYGSLPVICFLLKEHLKLNDLENIDHGSILCEAISNTNLDILAELCKTIHQQDCNEKIGHILSRKQDSGIYPLELCVQQSKVEAFEYLLNPEFQLQINFFDSNKATIIHYILEKLKENQTRKHFLEILVTAMQVREGKQPKSTYIADTPLVDCCTQNTGQTPLHVCASKYPDCICTLLRLNPSPIQGDSCGDTALHLAVRSGHIACVNEIIEKYTDNGIAEITNKPNDKKQTPLHIAVETDNLEIVKLLLSHQSKLYAVDEEKMTVLHYAVRINDSLKSENMVEFLLKYETENPEPNESLSTYQDKQGYTPLHLAISCLNIKAINILLKYPIDCCLRDLEGNTILHLAILLDKNEIEVSNILESKYNFTISNEADFVNLKNEKGKTALILAVEMHNIDALEQILKYFPLLSLTDEDGNSCLHKAVEKINDLTCLGIILEIIKERCPNELYLSAVNVNGLSPLHYAIMFKNHGAIRKLCAYGANLAIQLQDGTLTLCNKKGITFNIVTGNPSSFWRTLKDKVWSDSKEYFICYNIQVPDKGILYQIVSLLPDLTSTEITTTNDLKEVTSVTERALQMICSCHSIEPLIHAIDIGWINFSKDNSENTLLWDVLCGDISDEVTAYLFKTYPEQMTSPKMFKSLENATKTHNKKKVLEFLTKHPIIGDQDITKPLDEQNVKKSTVCTLALTIKNSLEYSIDNDNNEILAILLQHGARINHLYENNVTLLHIIIRKRKPVSFLTSLLGKIGELQPSDSEKQLIGGVTIIDHQDDEGKTALHLCIESENFDLFKQLLEYRPDLALSDACGNNIVHHVAKLGSDSIANIILKSPPQSSLPKTFYNEANTGGCTPLHLVAGSGNENIFLTILNEGADLYSVDKLGQTVLHHSLKIQNQQSRLAMITLILNTHSSKEVEFIKRLDSEVLSALHIAVKFQYTDEVDLLLKADPTAVYLPDKDLQTPLHLAVVPSITPPSNRIFDLVLSAFKSEVIISETHQLYGRLICSQDINCKTALHLSIASKYDNAMKQLLEADACIDLMDINGDTILHEAVKHPEDPAIIECILQHIERRKSNLQDLLTRTNLQGLRPLHLAIIHQNLQAIRKLSPVTSLAFKNSSGIITLCDTINELKLRFLEDPDMKEYYAGYSFLQGNTTYWVITDLPNFSKTRISDEHCNFKPLRIFDNEDFLKVLLQCECSEPLSSIMREKKISLNHKIERKSLKVKISFLEFSAYFASSLVMKYIIEKYDRSIFEPINDKSLSLIEYAVVNPGIGTLEFLLNTLTTFQQNDSNKQSAITKCLKNSIEITIKNDETNALELLTSYQRCLCFLYGNDGGTLLHHLLLCGKNKVSQYAELILKIAEDLQIQIISQKFGKFNFINYPDCGGKTALHLAISKNRYDIIKVILKFNPDLSIQNEFVDTVLHHSVRNKNVHAMDALINVIRGYPEPKKYLEARNKDGLTPILLSVSNANSGITQKLLDTGVDFYARDENTSETLLHRVLYMKDNSIRINIIKTLLKYEKEALKLDNHKITILKDSKENTPLHHAVLKEQSDSVEILLSADRSAVLIPGEKSQTVLHFAVSSGNSSILDKIISCLNQQANATNEPSSSDYSVVCKQDEDGKTPVHLSIEKRNLGALKILLPLSNHCLEIVDNLKDTLLHYAVRVSEGSCVYLETVLQEFKSLYTEDFQTHLYLCNSKGFPPLQYAIELNKLQAANVLIENSVQLPFYFQDDYLLSSPHRENPLRFLYKTPKRSNPLVYWIGFRIEESSKVYWIATNLPGMSKTINFDRKSSIVEFEHNKVDITLLIAILQCHSTDPFKSAVDSKLITQRLRFDDGSTLLKYVGQFSTKEVIAYFIVWCKCVIFDNITKGESSLIEYTVANSDSSLLRFLLEKLNPIIDQSLTPLQPNCTEEVRNQYKISLCLKNALELSLNNDNTQALELLLKFNARYDHTYDQQNTLLHLMVIQHMSCEFIEFLLIRACGIEKESTDPGTIRFIDAQNARKETALHLALQMKLENTVKTILKFHPEITSKDSDGNTPLHLSILLNNFEIVETILNLTKHNLEIINAVNKQNCTPLHISVDNGDYNVTKLLLSSKANIYCQDGEKKTILHHAIQIPDCSIRSLMFNELIKYEGETFSSNELCTMQDINGDTPLYLAITQSDHGIVKRLLDFPSVLNVKNELQQTPLHLAVLSVHKEIFALLLESVISSESDDIASNKSIINAQDSKGYTPFHLSIVSYNDDALKKLFAINPSLETIDCEGNSILHHAVLNPIILKFLLPKLVENKFPLFYWQNTTGLPPLQFAIKHEMSESIKELINAGIDLAFMGKCDTITLCDMKEGLSLEIFEYAYEQNKYWVGFTFKFHNSLWILSELPKLAKTIQIHRSKPTKVKKIDTKLLEQIAECRSPEPLDVAFRNRMLNFNIHLDGFEITEIIAKKGTLRSIQYTLEKNSSTLIQGKDNHLSMVESAVSNPNLNVLEFLLESIEKSIPNTKSGSSIEYQVQKCLKSSILLSLINSTPGAFTKLISYNSSPITTLFTEGATLLHLIILKHKDTEFLNLLLLRINEKERKSPNSTYINNTRFIDYQVCPRSTTALHVCIGRGQLENFKALLAHQPDIYLKDSSRNTCLHIACKKRELEFTERLINYVDKDKIQELLDSVNDEKESPLHFAVKNGNVDVADYLLRKGCTAILVNMHGSCILHHTVDMTTSKTEQVEMIKLILSYQEEHYVETGIYLTEIQDNTGSTPLHKAIMSKNYSVVVQLISFSSALKIVNELGQMPLHLAVLSKCNEIFDSVLDSILSQEAESINLLEQRLTCVRQIDGKTPLHLSIESRNTHALQALLRTKPCLDVCDNKGNTILHYAVNNSFGDSTYLEIILKELNERYSDDYSYFVYFLNSRKLTPLHYSIELSNTHCIKKLLENQVNLAFPKPCGDMTLLDGIEGFKLLFVKWKDEYWIGYKFTKSNKTYWIVTNLPNLDQTEFVEGDLPTVMLPAFKLLEVISQSKSTEPLDAALYSRFLNLNTSLKHEQKDVHMSQVIARHGSKQSLRCLLGKTKSELFHRSDKKESMIECAVSNPNIDALEFLLHSLPPFQEQTDAVGKEPHSNNAQIRSCLMNSFRLSISNSSPCALISLLRFYPKIDCTYIDDNTLIHLMVIDNKPSQFLHQVLEVIREIEISNAFYANLQIINHTNFDKKTALHYCVKQKQLEILCVLLKFNPDVFVVDENDETPLHYAVNSEVLESVQTLYQYAPCLQHLSSQNKDENAALHLAVKNQNVEIVRYLLECEPPLQLQNNSGSTVLHLAVGIGDATQRKLIMDALLELNTNKGLNVTCIQDSQLKSPLHLAVTIQYLDIVHSLLAADSKALGIQDVKKQTPFHLTIIPSCSEGQVVIKDDKVFDNLLKVINQQGEHEHKGYCGGKHLICIQDERKRTAMHYAIQHHYPYAFTELLKTGSCLDLPDDVGNILVHEAGKYMVDVLFIKCLTAELEKRYPDILDCFKIENYGK